MHFISFIFLLLIFLIKGIFNYQFNESQSITFAQKLFFAKKICTYQGKPIIDFVRETITCDCNEGHKTIDLDEDILGFKIQCSYDLKKRSITFFLALLIPFGLDFFYLGHYWIASILLVLVLFSIIFIVFTIYYSSKYRDNYEKIKSENEEIDKDLEKKMNIISKLKS
ncbi:MAG: hypothetical protein MJ252_28610, partial [archaeon]|nr:hypothetical protein [archaeon]